MQYNTVLTNCIGNIIASTGLLKDIHSRKREYLQGPVFYIHSTYSYLNLCQRIKHDAF